MIKKALHKLTNVLKKIPVIISMPFNFTFIETAFQQYMRFLAYASLFIKITLSLFPFIIESYGKPLHNFLGFRRNYIDLII